jgi:hypothetical protein
MGIDMKLTSLFKRIEKITIKLSENQLFPVRGKNIQITCLYGVLWVTWPNRGERILKSGQTFRVSSRGKVCIVALSNAFFLMKKGRWFANKQYRGETGARNEETHVFPILLKTLGFINPIEKT